MIRSSHEESVREIAQGMLLGTQFQYFIPEVAAESTSATADVHVSSPPYNVHLEKMDLSYPGDVAGTSVTVQFKWLENSYENTNSGSLFGL